MKQPIVCIHCRDADHERCPRWWHTGRLVPDPDPYRERTRLLPEYVRCDCTHPTHEDDNA